MNSELSSLSLVLITPAWNEESFIPKTIRSVISQSIRPSKWIIVDDGSSDRTPDIVRKFTSDHTWIELVQLPVHRDRTFAAKVTAFNEGYKKLKNLEYDVIGNLDADISFDSEYFSFLLSQFQIDSDLGVAGTPFIENNYDSVKDSYEGESHVPGGCQLFRRTCFEEIGGYIPVKGGGIDWIAVTTARMKGWKTRSFPQKRFIHYRPLGTGDSNKLGALIKHGFKDYYLGGHPLWQLFRVCYQMTRKPILIGGLMLIVGYLKGLLRGSSRPVSPI
jgi:glycosyltransferase involved in cell wall biosynthesis